MKNMITIVVMFSLLAFAAGCHSGTTRGIGSDISKLGDKMQS